MGREKKKIFFSLPYKTSRSGLVLPSLPFHHAQQPASQWTGGGNSCDSPEKNSLSVRGACDKAGRGTPGRPVALASRLPGKSRRNNRQFTFAASQPAWVACFEGKRSETHPRSRPIWLTGDLGACLPSGAASGSWRNQVKTLAELLWRITTPVIHTPMLIKKFDYITLKMSQLPPLDNGFNWGVASISTRDTVNRKAFVPVFEIKMSII